MKNGLVSRSLADMEAASFDAPSFDAPSEITSLENSSKKLADSEQELISLAQKRRAKRNAQEDRGDRYYTRSAHEGGNIVERGESDNRDESKQQHDPNYEKRKKKSRVDFETYTRRAESHPEGTLAADPDAFTPMFEYDKDRHPPLFTGGDVFETNSWGPVIVDLPEVDVRHEQEGARRSSLYQLALQHLHFAQAPQAQAKFDKHHCLDYKDAFGEQGCSASGLSKSKLADVFETGTMPRKCDGLLSVNSVEVGNFEFKRASASKLEVACQLRKNIKINKSILLELDKYELECEDAEDAVSSAPKNVAEILEWEQVVFHTPTKVAKRPSLLDRLKRAKEEADQGSSEDEVENLLASENE
ncbi:hypothetical protein KI688_010521 [Linnemannia hyalina]|uniref:Uncharacterized protein n=1 Tax=Linnemannia hyalina TaxID=64524 RepID=A0A9P7XYT3_9FUNG|nr:hypothetical protein KI688_010521 [Linnemannia hyalina]